MTELYGLVLAGGLSTRMGQDKAGLIYRGRTQLEAAFDLVSSVVVSCFVSVRQSQVDDPLRGEFPVIVDQSEVDGPAAGLLSAHARFPAASWLVVACDLPLLDRGTLDHLLLSRDGKHDAYAYRSEHDGLPEPLCAVWEPAALEALKRQVDAGKKCPRKCLINSDTLLIAPVNAGALDNINTPQERLDAARRLGEGA
ncbi:molybdenum cofactor guanylyltransferase [Gluconobacter wancherniae]|uniref:molybdenum cofactor guanylyltransferase n=1 Tax=Gluconobacter wancherniae TaxID=1307955 RepID=UPI0030A1E581